MENHIRHSVLGGMFAAAVLSITACGGGRVVVANPTPVATPLVAPAPAGGPVVGVLATVPTMPAPQSEAVSVSPGQDYVWVKGYYNWDGSHYQWVAGTWVRESSPGAVWVPAHWQPTTGGYVWVPGAWQ
jgi:hypothetical protein